MDDALRDFKADPTPDNLIRLLRTEQDRVYRLCFQVLCRSHDAEDAAQVVLMRIADGARQFGDPESFRRWVYRVSLNAALEVARKAARRRAHESRAAMKESPPSPLDDESRRALFEAIEKLEDGPRTLLLDHYFEGETLESLGSRQGVSPQAVSKRLDRAREDLKRALPAAFLGVPDLGRLFERGVSTPAVPDLVSGAVLAKCQSMAAVLAAGGAVMTAKTSIMAAVAVAVLVLMGAWAGLRFLLNERVDALPPGRTAGGHAPDAKSSGHVATAAPAAAPVTTPAPDESAVSPLTLRLNRYKAWMKTWLQERKTLGENVGVDPRVRDHAGKKYKELPTELEGIRDLITGELATFLEFLKSTENETYIGDLLLFAFGCTDSSARFVKLPFNSLSQPMTEGLVSLLRGGSELQKAAILDFFSHVSKLPSEFESLWSSMLAEPDPRVAAAAVRVVTRLTPQSNELFEQVRQVGTTNAHREVKWEVTVAMIESRRPEAQEYLFRSLEKALQPDEITDAAMGLANKLDPHRKQSVALDQDRLLSAISSALDRAPGDLAVNHLAWIALLCWPIDKVRPILDRARALASTPSFRDRMDALLQRIDEGDRRSGELRKLASPWASDHQK